MSNNIYKQQSTSYLEGLRDRLIEESATNTQAQWIAMMISDILNERKSKPEEKKLDEGNIPCGWLCWWECWLACKNL
jgi:hypothetical protein